jgi:cyclopropane-fatty-acyl-phospholipid synthase
MVILRCILETKIKTGRLSVTYDDGRTVDYGDGSGPPVAARLTARGERRISRNPQLGFGEAYMDGDLTLSQGQFWDLVEIIGANHAQVGAPVGPLKRTLRRLERILTPANGRTAARRNVHHHYDLSLDLYRRFLDEDLQYSCAYFADPKMTLDQAQRAKKAHLAAKLSLTPGQKVLDIGCGWGGLGLELAGRHGAQVTGITLSDEQFATAQRRAEASGLTHRAQFRLADYRDVEGPYDRIVSVGMLEHVGAHSLTAYFRQVARLLTDDGVAVVHAIGSRTPPGVTQPFIAKYIFPGGYIPSLSEVTAAVEEAGLWIADVEILRLHYAQTLRCWRERFMARRSEIRRLYDERFCRMWEVYLCFSELAFRYLNCMVFQLQLTKRAEALPLTRDYIHDREEAEPILRRA